VVYDQEGNVQRYHTKDAAEYATLQNGTNGNISIEDEETTDKPNEYGGGHQQIKKKKTHHRVVSKKAGWAAGLKF
jgi:hypothetical protein